MEIKKEFPHINFLEKEPMSRHTTFRIGGPAGLFASVQVADVAPLVSYCKTHDIPVTILGNGSNVLVGDQGIEGLVLSFGKEASAITVEGNQIRAEAGALLSRWLMRHWSTDWVDWLLRQGSLARSAEPYA